MSKKWIGVGALVVVLVGAFIFNSSSGGKIVEDVEAVFDMYGIEVEKVSFSRFSDKLTIEGLSMDYSAMGIDGLTVSVKKIEASGYNEKALDPTNTEEYPTVFDKLVVEEISYIYEDDYSGIIVSVEHSEVKDYKHNLGKLLTAPDLYSAEFWNALLNYTYEDATSKNMSMAVTIMGMPVFELDLAETTSSMNEDFEMDFAYKGLSVESSLVNVELEEFSMTNVVLPPREIFAELMVESMTGGYGYSYYLMDELAAFYVGRQYYETFVLAGLDVVMPEDGTVVKFDKIYHNWYDDKTNFTVDSFYVAPSLLSLVLNSNYEEMFKDGITVSSTLEANVESDTKGLVKFSFESDELANASLEMDVYDLGGQEFSEMEYMMNPELLLMNMAFKEFSAKYEDKGLIPFATLLSFENDYYYEDLDSYVAALNDMMTYTIDDLKSTEVSGNEKKLLNFVLEILEGAQTTFNNPGKMEISFSAKKPVSSMDDFFGDDPIKFDGKVTVKPGKDLLDSMPKDYRY